MISEAVGCVNVEWSLEAFVLVWLKAGWCCFVHFASEHTSIFSCCTVTAMECIICSFFDHFVALYHFVAFLCPFCYVVPFWYFCLCHFVTLYHLVTFLCTILILFFVPFWYFTLYHLVTFLCTILILSSPPIPALTSHSKGRSTIYYPLLILIPLLCSVVLFVSFLPAFSITTLAHSAPCLMFILSPTRPFVPHLVAATTPALLFIYW